MELKDFIKLTPAKVEIISFSSSCLIRDQPVSSIDESVLNFSKSDPEDPQQDFYHFSLREYIRERIATPKVTISIRIKQLVSYINSTKIETLQKHSEYLKDYLASYIFDQINSYVQTAINKLPLPNLNIKLGLSSIIKNKTTILKFQRYLKLVAQQQSTTGVIRKDVQINIRTYYQELMDEVFRYIENKYINSDKKGVLVQK